MKRPLSAILLLGLLIAASAPAPAPAAAPSTDQRVVLAGGCFWGMQLVFEQLKGVDRVVAGYAGGEAATAQYETVSTGATGHAESVEITYDPAKISFKSLLDVYFKVAHDPTELNRQGPDQGTQYRSEIFYTTGEQRTQALGTIAHLEQTRAYSSRVVTVVAPLH
ncbi:MAG: peptide-methionine (S)-S-oxide reductase MsrA, partial [Candidatus Cybelea sp.]